MPFQDLKTKCNEIFESISISQDEALNMESQTRSQGKRQKWHELRAGRITASVMKKACRTNLDIPSLSSIKKNCYQVKFRSIATDWGIEHENAAKECYFSIFSSSNLTIRDSGLIINPNYPYIGASPDAIVECKCCGVRCLEIKYLYSHRGDSILKILGKKS